MSSEYVRPRRKGTKAPQPDPIVKTAPPVVHLSPYYQYIVLLQIFPDALVGIIDQYAALTHDEKVFVAVERYVTSMPISGKERTIFTHCTHTLTFKKAIHRSNTRRHLPHPTFIYTDILDPFRHESIEMSPSKFVEAICQKHWVLPVVQHKDRYKNHHKKQNPPKPKRISVHAFALSRIHEWLGVEEE
jgi:hypothetical protein